jgi:hypothetical protein
MFWLIPALAAAGAAGGYFGTSKQNRGKSGLKNAALGALGGGTLGIGAGALMGAGAATGATAPAMSLASGGVGTAAGVPIASAAPAMSLTGGGVGTAAGVPITSAPLTSGNMGFLKGLMYNDPKGNQLIQGGKSMLQSQLLSGLMGGGEQSQPLAAQSIPYNPPQSANANMTVMNPYNYYR